MLLWVIWREEFFNNFEFDTKAIDKNYGRKKHWIHCKFSKFLFHLIIFHLHIQNYILCNYLPTNLFFLYLNLQKGVITKVYDGDTLTFVPDNKKHDEWKIRLAEIDCPESDQPCGKEATDFLKVF